MIYIFDYKEWDQFDLCYAIDYFFSLVSKIKSFWNLHFTLFEEKYKYVNNNWLGENKVDKKIWAEKKRKTFFFRTEHKAAVRGKSWSASK